MLNLFRKLYNVIRNNFVLNTNMDFYYDDEFIKNVCDIFLKCKSFQELCNNFTNFCVINNIMFQYSEFELIYQMREVFVNVLYSIIDNNFENFYYNVNCFYIKCEWYKCYVDERDLKIINLCLDHLLSLCD